MTPKAVAIIPARLGSTRFPAKALADETGKALVVHVCEQASKAESIERVVVATDADEIKSAVERHGFEVVMTSIEHENGTSRIAEIAGRAMERGWETYLSIMVLISVNLGILNLLPIPILDGGQALLFIVEGVKRSPLSVRSREIVQSIGLTMLMMLMGLAFWNDISRHWSKVIDWLRSGPGL